MKGQGQARKAKNPPTQGIQQVGLQINVHLSELSPIPRAPYMEMSFANLQSLYTGPVLCPLRPAFG